MVGTHDCAIRTLFSHVLHEIFVSNIHFPAFEDAFESCTIVNFAHNWVQMFFSLKCSVAVAAFSGLVIHYAVAADNFVAGCTIPWLISSVITVSTYHPLEQAVWAGIERMKLGLQLLVR